MHPAFDKVLELVNPSRGEVSGMFRRVGRDWLGRCEVRPSAGRFRFLAGESGGEIACHRRDTADDLLPSSWWAHSSCIAEDFGRATELCDCDVAGRGGCAGRYDARTTAGPSPRGKRDCTGRASRTLRLLAAPGGPAPPCRFRLTGIQAMRARSSRATKSVCSGEFRPCWTMANTALTSPRIKAAGSSQRPGNTVLRRMPSASGLRGL